MSAALPGKGLPQAWAGQPQWRVLEIGFGVGLNFLATWHAWRSDPLRPRLLHFCSMDASAVAADELLRAAAEHPELQPLAQALEAQWEGLVPGFHRLVFENGRVLLTLCVGDVPGLLREQSFRADAVFLDGLARSCDPHMAEPRTLKAVTRLARRGATLAASTLAAAVQRELQACGWQLEPVPERGGLAGRYAPAWEPRGQPDLPAMKPAECIVIGAGLAGAAAAASLARRGWSVQVIDGAMSPATGASGLPAGLLAPHQSPDDNLLSRLSRAGVRITLQQAARLAAGIEWERTGTLESRGDDVRPLPPVGEALQPWTREATEAQKRAAGIDVAQSAWWHANAAWIEPAALVRLWLREQGVRFHGGRSVARIRPVETGWLVEDATNTTIASAPLVVVAAALGSAALFDDGALPLHPVRGQLTWAPHGEDAASLPSFPVNGNGHFLPRVPLVERGAWITGSSYGRNDADSDWRPADDLDNLQRVQERMPRAAEVMQAAMARGETRSWSGVRCASADRRPLVGEVAPGLWVSTAMGSRGLTFAALCGELIAARLHGEPLPLEARLAQALDVSRRVRPRSG